MSTVTPPPPQIDALLFKRKYYFHVTGRAPYSNPLLPSCTVVSRGSVKALAQGRGNRVPTPTRHSSTRGKAGRNPFNEEITPSSPLGIGERYSQTISNLGHAVPL
jgi:hypothetical protein